jgi:3-dehydroquinate dehydratase/shikimate dehydrogenase
MLFCTVVDSLFPDLSKVRADGLELRLDEWGKIDVNAWERWIIRFRKESSLKLLLTLRPQRQGGKYCRIEEERLDLLRQLCRLNPDYLDLEYDIPWTFWREISAMFPRIQLICSYHDFQQIPLDLDQILASIKNPYAHLYKIAANVSSSTEALQMMEWTWRQQEPLIGIPMGKKGAFARILGPVVGNIIDYAALTQEAVPGQLSQLDMEQPYRYTKLNLETALLGLIGSPVDKSLGHLVHNGVFEGNQINAVYVKMEVQPEDLFSFIDIARKLPFKGLSVTMPLKEAVIPFLDTLSPEAEAMGAVNTIAIEEGSWIGHNTDGAGALDAIEKKMAVQGKRLIVIGAGGAAKAVIYEAVKRGAEVTIVNRTLSKAEHLAERFHCCGKDLSHFPQIVDQGYDLLINAIPTGEVIKDDWLIPGAWAMDLVYIPKMTPFLSRAAKRNCRLIFGEEMFIGQAIRQQQIWYSGQSLGMLHQMIESLILSKGG